VEAFLKRLLELVPIYYEAGRELAGLDRPADGPSAIDLAALACQRWLLGAIPASGDAMGPVATHVAAAHSPAALIGFARDVAVLAGPLGDDGLAVTARHAEACASAAADARDADAGRAAADCLYSRRSAGTDYIVAEARAVTAVPPGRRPP
jgi:hypothetical protein